MITRSKFVHNLGSAMGEEQNAEHDREVDAVCKEITDEGGTVQCVSHSSHAQSQTMISFSTVIVWQVDVEVPDAMPVVAEEAESPPLTETPSVLTVKEIKELNKIADPAAQQNSKE